MQFQIADAQEELITELTEMGSLAVVLLVRMFDNIVATQHRLTAHLTLILSNG